MADETETGEKQPAPLAQTLDMQRAAFAWRTVQSVPPARDFTEYRSLVRNLPAMLQMNGLGQTLSFLLAGKPGSAKQRLYQHMQEWLCDAQAPTVAVYATGEENDKRLLIRYLAHSSSHERRAVQEVLALSVYLKRFVEGRAGLLDSQKGENNERLPGTSPRTLPTGNAETATSGGLPDTPA